MDRIAPEMIGPNSLMYFKNGPKRCTFRKPLQFLSSYLELVDKQVYTGDQCLD